MISSDSQVGGVGAQHNRCCLISKIIEWQGSVPWQRSPYELLTLEECQGRIRSAKVRCTLWNSTLKQHQGERREGGVFSGAQVEISGTAQPGFFVLQLTLVSQKREQKRYTPESRLQSNYFEQWKEKEKGGIWEGGVGREREKCMRIAILSCSLLHTGCITTSLKKILTAQ